MAEDSTVFDSRTCSIPLSALRLDTGATNVYQLAQGEQIALRIKFKNEVGWSSTSAVYEPSALVMEGVPHTPTVPPARIGASTFGTQIGV